MRNDLEIESRPSSAGAPCQPVSSREVARGLAHCLIVSASSTMRDGLANVARDAGWETIVCADESAAVAAVRRMKFQMAWVDMESPEASSGLTELCQSIAVLPQVLLVIGGHQQDPQEEIWARQLGAWLYLPGVSSAQWSELQVLYEQAYLVTDSQR